MPWKSRKIWIFSKVVWLSNPPLFSCLIIYSLIQMGGLNTSRIIEWWSEYLSAIQRPGSVVPGIWIADNWILNSDLSAIQMVIWIYSIRIPTFKINNMNKFFRIAANSWWNVDSRTQFCFFILLEVGPNVMTCLWMSGFVNTKQSLKKGSLIQNQQSWQYFPHPCAMRGRLK